MEIVLYPPVAFVIYLVLVGAVSGMVRAQAMPAEAQSRAKRAAYASGEAGATHHAAPGYRQFFVVALFFAVLHLGVLMVASASLTPVTGAYLGGLVLVLMALILG